MSDQEPKIHSGEYAWGKDGHLHHVSGERFPQIVFRGPDGAVHPPVKLIVNINADVSEDDDAP